MCASKKLTPLLFTFVILYSNACFGQSVDYNTIILPKNAKSLSTEEKLVQLAWQNNPQNRILENQLHIAKKQIAITTADWLDIIRVNGNINEFTLNPDLLQGRTAFYPRYNFGAAINLGMFISTPAKTKIAKLEYANQEESIKSQKLALRAEVLRKYYIYKQNEELYKIQSQITEDSYSSFQMAEQQFKNGEIQMEDYNASFSKYFAEKSNETKLKTQFEISQVDLEELIGVKLDDVLN